MDEYAFGLALVGCDQRLAGAKNRGPTLIGFSDKTAPESSADKGEKCQKQIKIPLTFV